MEAKKVVVGVLRLSLMSGEADFDEAKGEVEAQIGRASCRERVFNWV